MDKAPVTFDQFYGAVGSALSSWAIVEEAMRDLFTRLVSCSITGAGMGTVHLDGLWVLGSAFYSTTNFQARLQLIGRIVARIVANDELQAEWNAVNNKALLLYKRRNVLAHGAVYGGSDGVPTAISYSIFDERTSKTMSYVQVCAQASTFEKFEHRETALAVAMNRHLAEYPRPPATLPVTALPDVGLAGGAG